MNEEQLTHPADPVLTPPLQMVQDASGTSEDFDVHTAMCGSIRRLSHNRRYSSFRAIWPENVAEHSFYHSSLAWMLACDFNRRGYIRINPERVAVTALLGDLPEAMTGDLITIYKNCTPELKFEAKRAEVLCADAMFDEYGPLKAEVGHAYNGTDLNPLELAIVKFADLLCVAQYAREEAAAGNEAFRSVVRDIHRDMRQFREHDAFRRYVVNVWPNDEAEDLLREPASAHLTDRYPKVGF